MKTLYLLINIFAIIIPFFSSFGPRIRFYTKWKYLFPALFLSMAVFIPWDILKTHFEVWGFNEKYLTGLNLVNLPIEEWMFFIAIPYACIFTYEVVIYLSKKDILAPYKTYISIVLILFLIVTAIIFSDRIYTLITFLSLAAFLTLHEFVFKSKYLSWFYLTYLICLFPFLIVNGILTGMFIPEQIVWYDDTQNLGFRIFTIPLEDVFYGMFLILMNLTFYELFKKMPNRKTK